MGGGPEAPRSNACMCESEGARRVSKNTVFTICVNNVGRLCHEAADCCHRFLSVSLDSGIEVAAQVLAQPSSINTLAWKSSTHSCWQGPCATATCVPDACAWHVSLFTCRARPAWTRRPCPRATRPIYLVSLSHVLNACATVTRVPDTCHCSHPGRGGPGRGGRVQGLFAHAAGNAEAGGGSGGCKVVQGTQGTGVAGWSSLEGARGDWSAGHWDRRGEPTRRHRGQLLWQKQRDAARAERQ